MEIMGIETPLFLLKTMKDTPNDPNDKLLSICQSYGATHYISGPSAKDYIDVKKFKEKGMELKWMSYDHYLKYPQIHPPFEHGVSILDMIFNVGPEWKKYMG